jgi:ADP-ribose pyrophosphatase
MDLLQTKGRMSSEETLYDAKLIRLVRKGKWEYVVRKNISGIVVIVAVTDEGRLLLVEQDRPPVGKRVIELPAGLAGDEPGSENEDLTAAARRELLEETGYEAAEMIPVTTGVPSAGIVDEVITLFRATGLRKTGDGAGVGGEEITHHEIPLDQVEAFLADQERAGKGIDIKIFAGLYFVR